MERLTSRREDGAVVVTKREYSHGRYLPFFNAYACEHPERKDSHIFKGKTKPHCCPLTGGKKYLSHGNSGRNTGMLSRDMITAHFYG